MVLGIVGALYRALHKIVFHKFWALYNMETYEKFQTSILVIKKIPARVLFKI